MSVFGPIKQSHVILFLVAPPGVTLYAFPHVRLLHDLIVRFEKERGRMIVVGPVSECSPWFPRMCPMIQGQRFDLPEWEDALSQASGQLRALPRVAGRRLAAWMLFAPGS